MATQPEFLNEGIGIGGEAPQEALIATNGHSNGLMTVRYSETIGKLALALSQAQLNFKPIKKQLENPFYSTDRRKAMYADLAAIIEATQKALAEKELVVFESPVVDFASKKAGVISRLAHSSGEWKECELLLPATSQGKRWSQGAQIEYEKFDAQTIGKAITYARRYTYGPTAGVAAEEDDDANQISEAGNQGSKEAAQAVANRKINEHVAKKVTETGKVPAIFYSWQDDEQKAYITGEVALLSANKELLQFKAKWSSKANAFITDDVGLEDLKFELHERGVLFIPAKGQELTAALQESIVQEKKKKASREPGDDAK